MAIYGPRYLENGAVRYDVQVDVEDRKANGKKRTISRTARSKKGALALERKLKNLAEQGALLTKLDVGQLLDKWIALHSTGDDAWVEDTRYNYERIVEGILKPAVGKIKVEKLTGLDLDEKVYEPMKERGCSSGRVHNVHSVIRAALNQARKWKMVSTNVAYDATPGAVIRHEGVKATDTEVDALMAAIARIEAGTDGQSTQECLVEGCQLKKYYGRGFCYTHWKHWRYQGRYQDLALPSRRGGRPRGLRKDGIKRIKLGMLIVSETGIRRGEAAGVDWADFDWRNNMVKIQRAKDRRGQVKGTKTHATREIPLSAAAVAVLKEHRGIGPVVGMTPRQLSAWWDYICEEAGIEPLPEVEFGRKRRQKKIGWHSLRHRLLSDLGGVTDIKTVATIGGHATTRTTERYMHGDDERKVAAIDALAKKRQAAEK